ncbi:hypothetical protein BaRGS_00022483 [Batillaria attramentaria]|uniref:C3H1-type domain-containing protein n=1 Tax=Batillaria attramentaria TaxID=370345 RepID=A0ABD0KGK4_9CAEN
MDSARGGKCQRKDPPCKYLHPPQHLREQLLQNGRNNLILKSLQLQALQHQVIPGIIPMAAATSQSRPTHVNHPASFVSFASPTATPSARNSSSTQVVYSSARLPPFADYPYDRCVSLQAPHYFSTVPTSGVPQFNPLIGASVPGTVAVPGSDGTMVTQQIPGVVSTPISAAKAPSRPDRLEVCREFQRGTCSRQTSDCRYAHPTENVTVDSSDNHVTVCMDFIKNKCTRDSCRYFHPPAHLQSQIKAAQQRANASVSAQPTALVGRPSFTLH